MYWGWCGKCVKGEGLIGRIGGVWGERIGGM